MRHSIVTLLRNPGLFLLVLSSATALAGGLEPGKVVSVTFPESNLPQSLYTMVTGVEVPPTLEVRLPDNYDPDKRHPLLLYVPGNHGGKSGNIGNAQTIAGPTDWVVASLPLFKRDVDRDEIGSGILVGFQDVATLSDAYRTMLGRLFELVPNIDPDRSAIVGFSNGALAVAVLVSSHDEFVLSHFQEYCLVDHGMFHLTDLYKQRSRNHRYLVLAGDKQDMGRDLKIRGGQLLQDTWRLVGVDISFHVLKDTGHEFTARQMAIVGRWLRHEAFFEGDVVSP